jgi:hypothetical protein
MIGARGTMSLLAEQRPRSQKRTRRTQPYRRRQRESGPALSAMLRGSPFYLPNPMDLQRQTLKRRGR